MASVMTSAFDLDRVVWDEEYRQKVKRYFSEQSAASRSDPEIDTLLPQDDQDFLCSFKTVFEPIVNLRTGKVFAHEALTRGINGASVGYLFDVLAGARLYQFDHLCRTRAMKEISQRHMEGKLSLNVMPGAIDHPRYGLHATFEVIKELGIAPDRLIFELSERECLDALGNSDLAEYRSQGALFAIDDFGTGHAGLQSLLGFQPDIIKLDISLIRDIDKDSVRQTLLKGILSFCAEMNIHIIAEGVETPAEREVLFSLGVDLIQGFILTGGN